MSWRENIRGAAPGFMDYFPALELVIHGGVDFAPYRRRFAEWLEGSQAELREVYAASEGFIAAADRGEGEGLRVVLDRGIFYEFVPVAEIDAAAPTRHWIGDIETGVDYALVLTTCAGLWAYVLGDTVRFVSRDPPRLLVTGRLSYTLSAFGEHLTGEEITEAVTGAANAIGAGVRDFAVGALYPEKPGEIGGHLYIVEFERAVSAEETARFAAAIDADLMLRNLDYRDHRAGGFGLTSPQIGGCKRAFCRMDAAARPARQPEQGAAGHRRPRAVQGSAGFCGGEPGGLAGRRLRARAIRNAKARINNRRSPPISHAGDKGSLSFAPPTRTVTRAISLPEWASALHNPSLSAGNSNFPALSVRPVSAGWLGLPGAKTRTSASAIGFPSAVANCTVTCRAKRLCAAAGPVADSSHSSIRRTAARPAWPRRKDKTLCIATTRIGDKRDEDSDLRRRRGRRPCRGTARRRRGGCRDRGGGGGARRAARRDPRARHHAVDRRGDVIPPASTPPTGRRPSGFRMSSSSR